MRRILLILAGLLLVLVSQVAVLWGTVLLATSSAFERFRNLGPGSVGDLILLLVVATALEAVLAGLLMVVLKRHRRSVFTVLMMITTGSLITIGVLLALAVA